MNIFPFGVPVPYWVYEAESWSDLEFATKYSDLDEIWHILVIYQGGRRELSPPKQ